MKMIPKKPKMTKQQKWFQGLVDVIVVALTVYAFASEIDYLPQWLQYTVKGIAIVGLLYSSSVHSGYIEPGIPKWRWQAVPAKAALAIFTVSVIAVAFAFTSNLAVIWLSTIMLMTLDCILLGWVYWRKRTKGQWGA